MHLVGFTTEIYYHARSYKRQICSLFCIHFKMFLRFYISIVFLLKQSTCTATVWQTRSTPHAPTRQTQLLKPNFALHPYCLQQFPHRRAFWTSHSRAHEDCSLVYQTPFTCVHSYRVLEKPVAFVCRVVQEELSLADTIVLHRKLTRNVINPLQTKRILLYLKTQFVPRCKHFPSRL